jgi:transcription termination factor Rho
VGAKKAPIKKNIKENLTDLEFEWSDEGMLTEHAPSPESADTAGTDLDLAAAQSSGAARAALDENPMTKLAEAPLMSQAMSPMLTVEKSQPESQTESQTELQVGSAENLAENSAGELIDLKADLDDSANSSSIAPQGGVAGANTPTLRQTPMQSPFGLNRPDVRSRFSRDSRDGQGYRANNGGYQNNDRSMNNLNSMGRSNLRPMIGGINRNRLGFRTQNNGYGLNNQNGELPDDGQPTEVVTGILDTSREGHGIVRQNFGESDRDAYISTTLIRRLRLLPGDVVSGPARMPKENDRYWGMTKVDTVNGLSLDDFAKKGRVNFKSLTPVYPDVQLKLETGKEPLSLRIIDMVAPIGKGQRSLIVSPPKAGKTTLLKDIATGVAKNNPEIHVMAVLVGERPEEVTDIRRHVAEITSGKGEVAASNFDESAQDQCRVAELALERAKRLVESGKDVLILLDSITRLARAYNLAMPTSGRTLSGGFDPAALFPPKKFFGAARNFEVPGSLTIIGTALVDTGSRMDDLVYEEFKGTGNQEVILDRHLGERRVWPAIDVQKSGTRRDDLLIDPVTYQSIITLQRMLDMLDKEERTMTLIERLRRTDSNKEFLASLKTG